jgi:hypothetical protein
MPVSRLTKRRMQTTILSVNQIKMAGKSPQRKHQGDQR